MTQPWIDISVSIRSGMVLWPGDPPTSLHRVYDLGLAHECTLSRLDMCVHAGTHIDAPAHFIPGGASIDMMPPAAGIGTARVIAIKDPKSITVEELGLHRIKKGDRILFKTANSERNWFSEGFVEDFVSISVDAARYLAKRKVMLVGIDYLSVGRPDDDGTRTHKDLLAAGVWLLEGLDLSQVEPGLVQLLCLPLKLAEAEGAPARAFVRPMRRRQKM